MSATAQIDLFPSRPASRIDVGPGAVIVCYGAGVDSTAMLVAMYQQGIRPDLITFADTGGEKPETLEQVGIMSDWLAARG
jgi:hypothetical protein